MSEKLLEVAQLTKEYQGFKLGPVDLTIEPGEIVGMVGANGAGKTTLMKCILGLTRRNSGDLRLFGQNAPEGATPAMRNDIGVVLDACQLPKAFKPKDVRVLMRNAYANWDQATFEKVSAQLGVSDYKDVGSLSRGMGMKLSMAVALSHSPKLLLLDEATAGLDPMVRDEVLEMLRRYIDSADAGILLCTHITSDLEKAADRVVCLNNGKVVFSECRETITDMAGIARCRQADLDLLYETDLFETCDPRFLHGPYGIDVLVPDRFDFAKRIQGIPCDRCSIEDYMRFMLKGDQLYEVKA